MAGKVITNSGAAVVPLGTSSQGLNGKVVLHITAIANPGKFVGRAPGAGADVDLKCYSAADPAAAPAATFAAIGIYWVEDNACLEISASFGAADTKYVVAYGMA
jgi:hypothetical protein